VRWSDDGARLDDPGDLDRFGEMVGAAAQPIDDHRGSAAYRRHAVGVMAARCIRGALA
jgi:CO/xanthine dehydrogenase FAD-binding subunit